MKRKVRQSAFDLEVMEMTELHERLNGELFEGQALCRGNLGSACIWDRLYFPTSSTTGHSHTHGGISLFCVLSGLQSDGTLFRSTQ